MDLYLAVDVGGTKTDYLLADDTRELARTRTPTIKRMRASAEVAAANLARALAELTAASGLPLSGIVSTCIGTAGESVPLVRDWLHAAFTRSLPGKLLILGDVEIALDAAFPGQPGIVAIAGTGSNVAGRDHHGKVTTAGGWGPALADQGSGHRIGHEALRASFLALDQTGTTREQDAPTILLPAILDFWDLDSLDHLIEYANGCPAPDFSQLTTLVLACAREGDEVARTVLRREGEDLAHLVRLVIRRLQQASPDPTWVPPLAFTGSIMEKVAPVRESLLNTLRADFPSLQATESVVDPIAGALYRARTAPVTRAPKARPISA